MSPRWILDFISFSCKYCEAPFEKPQDLVIHKKEKHAVELGWRLNGRKSETVNGRGKRKAAQELPHGSSKKAATCRNGLNAKKRPRTSIINEKSILAPSHSPKKPRLRSPRKNCKLGRPMKCEMCGADFGDEKEFAKHLEEHEKAKEANSDFLCGKCDLRFLNLSSVGIHRTMVHGNQYSASQRIKFEYSVNSTHKEKPQLVCGKAKKRHSFVRTTGINSVHSKFVQGLSKPQVSESDNLSSIPNFKCSRCPKVYSCKGKLRRHERLLHKVYAKMPLEQANSLSSLISS